MKPLKTLIIIPAYNASQNLQVVLNDLVPYKKDIIIINDGSTDHTLKIITSNNFPHLSHEYNIGMGGAIKTGIKYGIDNGYSHAISLDADGQHDPFFIDDFKIKLTTCDFVMGCRFHSNTIDSVPSTKLASNFMGTAITYEVFGAIIKDTSCGYRGFKLSNSHFKINENGYGFVFKQLFNILETHLELESVNMPAVYPTDSLMCTRKVEIIDFCLAILPYAKRKKTNSKLTFLVNSLKHEKNFDFCILNWTFYGFYIKHNDSYIIQTEISDSKKFYKDI